MALEASKFVSFTGGGWMGGGSPWTVDDRGGAGAIVGLGEEEPWQQQRMTETPKTPPVTITRHRQQLSASRLCGFALRACDDELADATQNIALSGSRCLFRGNILVAHLLLLENPRFGLTISLTSDL
jgi:hypothetical protein